MVGSRYHGGFSLCCFTDQKGVSPSASFCFRRSLSSTGLVGANCCGCRPTQNPGSLSPLNGKTDYGCLFPYGFRGMAFASMALLKKEVEHASIAAAGSEAPEVTGKISNVGFVNSWVLDRDLRVSQTPDLSLDPQKCIKVTQSAEVRSGDTKQMMASSWILDPVFDSIPSPASGPMDLISAEYPLFRGYSSSSLDPVGSGFWSLGIVGTGGPAQGAVVPVFWVPFVNTDLVGSDHCTMAFAASCAAGALAESKLNPCSGMIKAPGLSSLDGVAEGLPTLGFAPMCSVLFRSELDIRTQHGCTDLETSTFNKVGIVVFRQSWSSSFLTVGGGSDSGICDHGGKVCRYSICCWSFQHLAMVLMEGLEAKSAIQISAQISPDLARQGSSISSIWLETSLGLSA